MPGQYVCRTCPAGYYCDWEAKCDVATTVYNGTYGNYTQPQLCPQGYYCPNGTRRSTQFGCPAGTYGASVGLGSVQQCTACPAGQYCGTVGATTPTGSCAVSHWCISGASIAAPEDNITGTLCPSGHYCPSGVASPSHTSA